MLHYHIFPFIKCMIDAKSKQTDLPVEFLDLQNFKFKLVQNGKDLFKMEQTCSKCNKVFQNGTNLFKMEQTFINWIKYIKVLVNLYFCKSTFL